MAHDVSFSVPDRPLGKADIEFKIKNDDGKLGTMRISKGSVVWFRRDGQKGHRISWTRLGQLIEEYGRPAEWR